MDDLRVAGLDAARKRVTPPPGAAAEADACAWRSSVPQRLGAGDRRSALPPSRRAGARDARRVGVGKAEEEVGGGSSRGTSRGSGSGAGAGGAGRRSGREGRQCGGRGGRRRRRGSGAGAAGG
ncbi:unnamed protein product [Urochloa humidicola]